MSRNRFEKLYEFIPYFKQCPKTEWAGGGQRGDGINLFSYPVYSDEINRFVKLCYDMDILVRNYRDILEHHAGRLPLEEQVETADRRTLLALLTACIRQERFGDGAIAHAVEKGTFYRILNRLKWLEEETEK